MAWNRPREREEGTGKREEGKKSPFRGLVAGVIVVIGAGIAAWLVWTMESAARVESATRVESASRRGAAGTVGVESATRRGAAGTVESAAGTVESAAGAVDAEQGKEEDKGPHVIMTVGPHKIVEVIGVETNEAYNEIVTRVRRDDGKVGELVRRAHPPLFDGTDMIIQMSLCHGKNSSTLPLPMMGANNDHDADFLASLVEPIIISKDDSEEVAEMKRTVREARKQIKDLMDKGYHFDDIINDYNRLTSENLDIRANAMRELREIHASGDKESAEQYRTSINAAFENMGIDPLDMPGDRPKRKVKANEE